MRKTLVAALLCAISTFTSPAFAQSKQAAIEDNPKFRVLAQSLNITRWTTVSNVVNIVFQFSNGDGVATKAEIEQNSDYRTAGARSQTLARVMRDDRNWDGVITRKEFDDKISSRTNSNNMTVRLFKKRSGYFDNADTNFDDKITMKEVLAYAAASSNTKIRNRFIMGLDLLLLDTNSDDQITLQEAETAALELFSKFDQNASGILETDEWKEAQKFKRRARKR